MKLYTFAKLVRIEYKLKVIEILCKEPFDARRLKNVYVCSLVTEVVINLCKETENEKLKKEYEALHIRLTEIINSFLEGYKDVPSYLLKKNFEEYYSLYCSFPKSLHPFYSLGIDTHSFRVNMLNKIVNLTRWKG